MSHLHTAHVVGPGVLHLPLPRTWPNKLLHLARRVALVVVSVALLSIVAQLLYPSHRSLPGARFAGYNLGLLSQSGITQKLQPLNSRTFQAKAVQSSYEVSLASIGLSWDVERIAEQLSDYPLSKRLVPFSGLFYRSPVHEKSLAIVDQAKLEKFADQLAAENNQPAVEGSIVIQDGNFTIKPSTAGVLYHTEDLVNYFSAISGEELTTEANLPYSALPALNSKEHLEGRVAEAEQMASQAVSVTIDDDSVVIPASAVKAAVRFAANPSTKLIELNLDNAALAAGLEEVADKAFMAPTTGQKGRELDRWATAADLATALKNHAASVQAVTKGLGPTSAKLYPATSQGINQLIRDWSQARPGLGVAVDFSEIGGFGRQASLRASDKYFSASVYKVFPAWYALDQIDKGKLDPNGTIAAGMNLSACFYNMITISASNCSEAIVAKYGGWSAMDSFIRAAGIDGISLSSGVTITASGMTQFLQKLDAGELLSPERTTYLLDALKHQKYRQGIPAGSAGEVADKVGYIPWSYSWHDAAIVYHPKGKYTLVMLTKSGASLTTLSDLARKVSDTLNR